MSNNCDDEHKENVDKSHRAIDKQKKIKIKNPRKEVKKEELREKGKERAKLAVPKTKPGKRKEDNNKTDMLNQNAKPVLKKKIINDKKHIKNDVQSEKKRKLVNNDKDNQNSELKSEMELRWNWHKKTLDNIRKMNQDFYNKLENILDPNNSKFINNFNNLNNKNEEIIQIIRSTKMEKISLINKIELKRNTQIENQTIINELKNLKCESFDNIKNEVDFNSLSFIATNQENQNDNQIEIIEQLSNKFQDEYNNETRNKLSSLQQKESENNEQNKISSFPEPLLTQALIENVNPQQVEKNHEYIIFDTKDSKNSLNILDKEPQNSLDFNKNNNFSFESTKSDYIIKTDDSSSIN